ncbi:MAG: GPI transamidase component [Watsoniomyces obsoletus]|nr:MAG: GPI transamidase component [Watsoniomyces obsoletus]
MLYMKGGSLGANYQYSWQTWFSCMEALRTRRQAYIKSLLETRLPATDSSAGGKSANAPPRTAQQQDLENLLLVGRSQLKGRTDIDWALTDAEVRVWVNCVYEHGGIVDIRHYNLPWDALFQCTNALKARHRAQSSESSTRSQEEPTPKKKSKKKGNTNAFSLLRSGPNDLKSFRDKMKHRLAEAAAGVQQQQPSSSGTTIAPDGQLWTAAATLARSLSTVKRPGFVPMGP